MSLRSPDLARGGRYAVGLALATGLLVVAVPAVSGVAWSAVTAVIASISGGGLVLLVVLWMLGLLAHTITLTAALPSLTHRRALTLSLTGSAVANVLPLGGAAGVALNYRMMRDWGYARPQLAAYTLVTNVWDVLAKLVLPLLVLPVVLLGAGSALPHAAGLLAVVGVVTMAAAVVTAAVVVSETLARRVGTVLERLAAVVLRRVGSERRPLVAARLVEVQRSCREVVAAGWGRLTLGMALYTALLLALLASCLSLTGAGLPLVALLGGFVVERLLTLAGVTPGGAGVVELGLTGVLVALGGPAGPVVSGVLLYRALTFGMEIPVGGVTLVGWLLLRRRARRALAAANDGAALRAPAPVELAERAEVA